MYTFPQINIKTTQYTSTPEVTDYLAKRLQTLEKYLPENETALMCDVELEKLSDQHNGPVYRAEINLQVAGTLLRAEATAETMEDAIDQIRNEMKTELTRESGKRASLFRRGARRLKELIRFGGE